MDRSAPRVTSVMGVASALLSTVDVDDAVEVLVVEFGWDLTFQALALLTGEDSRRAFGRAWEYLVAAPLTEELRPGSDAWEA